MGKYKIKPTEKQKKAFKFLSENGGSEAEALRQAGYSKSMQNTPSKVTRSEGWQMLVKELNKKIKDEDIADTLNNALKAKKKQFKNNNATGKLELVAEEPDYAIQLKAVDTVIKIKGQYAPEQKEVKHENAKKLLDLFNEE